MHLRQLRITLLLILLVPITIGAVWLGHRVAAATGAANDLLSQGRFDQLEVALLLYHDEHGNFPPTKSQREADAPVHSWRVLLLPHGSPDFRDRYSEYDFSQAWDTAKNMNAFGRSAPLFLRNERGGNLTQYLAIGPADTWPSKKALKSRLITKGKDRFLLVEYPDSDIHWLEPKY